MHTAKAKKPMPKGYIQYCVIPAIWHYGKDKIMEPIGRLQFWGQKREGYVEHKDF
jgi:hypothetical protein